MPIIHQSRILARQCLRETLPIVRGRTTIEGPRADHPCPKDETSFSWIYHDYLTHQCFIFSAGYMREAACSNVALSKKQPGWVLRISHYAYFLQAYSIL